MEPLRREVAMLREHLRPYARYGVVGSRDVDAAKVIAAFNDTQATAEAYERELKTKVLEELRNRFNAGYWNQADTVIREIDIAIYELRAQSEQKKGGE